MVSKTITIVIIVIKIIIIRIKQSSKIKHPKRTKLLNNWYICHSANRFTALLLYRTKFWFHFKRKFCPSSVTRLNDSDFGLSAKRDYVTTPWPSYIFFSPSTTLIWVKIHMLWGSNLNFIFWNCKLPWLSDIHLGKVLKLLQYRFSPRIKSNPNLSPNILIGVYTGNMSARLMKCNFITKIKARGCHKILRITSALTLMNASQSPSFSPIPALAKSPNQKKSNTITSAFQCLHNALYIGLTTFAPTAV